MQEAQTYHLHITPSLKTLQKIYLNELQVCIPGCRRLDHLPDYDAIYYVLHGERGRKRNNFARTAQPAQKQKSETVNIFLSIVSSFGGSVLCSCDTSYFVCCYRGAEKTNMGDFGSLQREDASDDRDVGRGNLDYPMHDVLAGRCVVGPNNTSRPSTTGRHYYYYCCIMSTTISDENTSLSLLHFAPSRGFATSLILLLLRSTTVLCRLRGLELLCSTPRRLRSLQ